MASDGRPVGDDNIEALMELREMGAEVSNVCVVLLIHSG